jgi:hypothetical protein
MTRPLKLIDDYLDFTTAASEYLLETNTNFIVVGVVGKKNNINHLRKVISLFFFNTQEDKAWENRQL